MNRLTQLAVESDLIEWDILPSGVRTPNHESVVKARKFAELIVKECVGRVRYCIQNDLDYIAEDIEQNFGVSE